MFSSWSAVTQEKLKKKTSQVKAPNLKKLIFSLETLDSKISCRIIAAQLLQVNFHQAAVRVVLECYQNDSQPSCVWFLGQTNCPRNHWAVLKEYWWIQLKECNLFCHHYFPTVWHLIWRTSNVVFSETNCTESELFTFLADFLILFYK